MSERQLHLVILAQAVLDFLKDGDERDDLVIFLGRYPTLQRRLMTQCISPEAKQEWIRELETALQETSAVSQRGQGLQDAA